MFAAVPVGHVIEVAAARLLPLNAAARARVCVCVCVCVSVLVGVRVSGRVMNECRRENIYTHHPAAC